MKKLKKITTAFILCTALFMHTPVMAQNDPAATTTNSDRDNDDDKNNWGLLGLLGLLGLVGLKRKDDRRAAAYSSTGTAR